MLRVSSPRSSDSTPPGSATDLGSDSQTVQRIVHRHGGRIPAAASPGEGATLSVTPTVGKV
jgi:light-regulated signal transduction histidine kinase (bacteriophytochrome)